MIKDFIFYLYKFNLTNYIFEFESENFICQSQKPFYNDLTFLIRFILLYRILKLRSRKNRILKNVYFFVDKKILFFELVTLTEEKRFFYGWEDLFLLLTLSRNQSRDFFWEDTNLWFFDLMWRSTTVLKSGKLFERTDKSRCFEKMKKKEMHFLSLFTGVQVIFSYLEVSNNTILS